MIDNIDLLISKMQSKTESEAFLFSDQLAAIGDENVIDKMIELLYHDDRDTQYLAARTLSLIKNNDSALEPLLAAIHDKRNLNNNGGMVEALLGFDCSQKFTDIFKIYLFGNIKSSAMAKMILDYQEFDITPRIIRKCIKHWNHLINNSKHDEAFQIRKQEIETIINELKELFNSE